nr:alpha/beta hydrolase [Alkalicoccus luteus]
MLFYSFPFTRAFSTDSGKLISLQSSREKKKEVKSVNSYWLAKTFHSSYGYVRYGICGEGPPLVLVHGTPWSSFNWRHLIPGLSEWFTVYYYDLVGYGKSEKATGDVSLGIQHHVLHELLEEWRINEPVVVGHDFGGTTALRTHLLLDVPYRKLVLIDPVALAPWGSSFFGYSDFMVEKGL